MKKILIALTIATAPLTAFSGPVQELMELAESSFSKGEYANAKRYYADIVNLQSATENQRDDARYNINVCQAHINKDLYNTGYNHALSLFRDKDFVQSRNACIRLLKYGKYKSKTNKLIKQCNDSIKARSAARQITDSLHHLNQLREEYNSIVEEAYMYYNNKQYLNAILSIKESKAPKYNKLGEQEPSWVDRSRIIYQAQQRGEAVTPELAHNLLNAIDVGNINNGIARIVFRENNADSTIYITTKGESKIRRRGHLSDDFRCGYLGSRYADGLMGFYDLDGKFHSSNEIQHDGYIQDVREFSDGMAPFQNNNKWGYINQDLKVAIAPQYDFVTAFSEGRAFVRKKGKWFVIDKDGKTILSKLYPAFLGSTHNDENGYCPQVNNSYYSDGKIWVQTNKFRNILADLHGNILLDEGDYNPYSILHNGKPLFEWVHFSEGLMIYLDHKKYGYMDASAKIVIEPKYDLTYGFNEELAAIKIDDKWGFIDKNGDVSISPIFDDVSRDGFSEGLCAAKSNGKWGYIDMSGNWIINPIYECPYRITNGSVGSFRNGFAAVALNGQLGYVDKFGNSTFDFQ